MKLLQYKRDYPEEKVGITFSQFDVLHAGHILMLDFCKQHCDYLVVGLQNDASIERPEKNKPRMSIVERQLILSSIKYIDDVIIYNAEQDILDILKNFPIDVRFIGSEYEDKEFTGCYGDDRVDFDIPSIIYHPMYFNRSGKKLSSSSIN